jgi:hypothetical protein
MVTGNRIRAGVLVVVVSLAGITLLASCNAERASQFSRMPGEKQLVGGGMMIEWRAPEAGTVYLVEKTTGKIVETRSLEEGEKYSWTVTSVVQAEDLQELLGIKFSKARFLLYFEPAVAPARLVTPAP